MNSTKFKVDILRYGSENENLLKAIANHNAGKVEINLVDIRGYCKIQTARWPTIPILANWHETDRHTLVIVEGNDITLVITKIEVEELTANDPDDLKDVL